MNKLFSTISFIGGVHGVGKSTICKDLCSRLNIDYLSASQLLKWAEMNTNAQNKQVQNIYLTQDRLIKGLFNIVKSDKHYLLDGHYCLFDKEGKIVRVPFETFAAINPTSLHLIIGDVETIKHRLEERDKRIYDYNLLKEMQEQEITYAKELSTKLSTQLSIGEEGDYSDVFNAIYKSQI